MDEDPQRSCPNRYGSSTTRAQQNVVFPVQTTSGVVWIWTGDRWQSSPSGIKAEDRQYWAPLRFAYDVQAQLELPQPLEWVDSFELTMPSPQRQSQPEPEPEGSLARTSPADAMTKALLKRL